MGFETFDVGLSPVSLHKVRKPMEMPRRATDEPIDFILLTNIPVELLGSHAVLPEILPSFEILFSSPDSFWHTLML